MNRPYQYMAGNVAKQSKDLAVTPLLPLHRRHLLATVTPPAAACPLCLSRQVVLSSYRDVDGCVEDLVHAAHLFGRALHVECAHLLRDGFALLLRDGRQALGLKQLDAGALVAEVGLQTAEDDGCRRTEMQDFGVPLNAQALRQRDDHE